METPILLGANPKIANPIEWIPIRFDRWTVRVEGLVDSKLIVALRSDWPIKEGIYLPANGKVYKGPCEVRVRFDERGTEKMITVFAVECK